MKIIYQMQSSKHWLYKKTKKTPLVIRILKELSEDLNSIKKIQSVTKDTLIKNNL